LTIRTHHTGVVRRRILPVMMYERAGNVPESLEYNPASELDARKLTGTDIRRDDKRKRSTGKLIAGLGNIGLGMCRLEQMTDLKVSSEPSSFTPEDRFILQTAEDSELGIKAFVPDWIRGSIREPKIQKRVG
jgi:folate-binding Fe-S cluster repair protein YgfZ